MSRKAIPIAIAVVRQDAHVLIGQRPPGVPLAGLWEFPGGKVHLGESPEQAAIRECREEAGIEIRIQRRYLNVSHRYDHAIVELHFFDAEPASAGQQVQEPFRWVPMAELPRYPFPPANTRVLDILRDDNRLS